MNSHLEVADGRKLSLFAAFFRIIKAHDKETKAPIYAHSMTWALTDAAGKGYFTDSRVDRAAPGMGIERIKKGYGSKDPRLNRAIVEILEKGRVPAPDRVFEADPTVNLRQLELDFGTATFKKSDDGSYDLGLANTRGRTGCKLTFHPDKPPTRHGDDGVVKGHGGEDMFYYFIPRCRVTGTVTVNGVEFPVIKASGWYDHEFGCPPLPLEGEKKEPNKDGTSQASPGRNQHPAAPAGAAFDIAWNWAGLQLDDGSEVTIYSLVRPDASKVLHQWAVVILPDGTRQGFTDVTLTPERDWRSVRTFHDYPTRWKLEIPGGKLNLTITAALDDQEFITVISKPAFWEGRCDVRGVRAGKDVTGLGYVERSGFEKIHNLDDYFSAVGEEVRRSVRELLPTEPTHEETRDLIASKAREHYMDGVDVPTITRSLFKPIREITDRGGKAWRSYAALACCDVVEGDSRDYIRWLSLPEMLHVGSLIVDDVQDHSTVRRGGPTCHMIYGEPIAINAGTAAYFLAHGVLFGREMSNVKKLRLYDLYFETMRAGHAGQALDLSGLADVMPRAVETGESSEIERRILAIHRLKTAAPAGALARMGAVAGDGTEAQIEGVGRFFESLGLAFQIIDDVLNLRGFKGELKSAGEDIANGTATLPVAKSMSRLPPQDRAWVWETLRTKPKDPKVIASVIQKLEACGGIEACSQEARSLVEDAWQKVEPLLPDSIAKVMLRAFGWYVLERHY